MSNNDLKLTYTKNGRIYEKMIDRQKLTKDMLGLYKGFDENNMISSIFLEVLPTLQELIINLDRNQEIDIPFVRFITPTGEQSLEIRRFHKYIWYTLNYYIEN